jgi:hypothetical protein
MSASPDLPAAGRVAIVGASGIGKHHAAWWHQAGYAVCAFVGSGPASVAATAALLKKRFGFDGRGYADLGTMLDQERPDFVDVCSPPRLHLAHARLALEHGCAVLCEKPLTYERGTSFAAQIAQCEQLVALAAGRRLRFGLCTQYAAMAEVCRPWIPCLREGGAAATIAASIASPVHPEPEEPIDLWMDLAPHMVAIVQTLVQGGRIVAGSLRKEFRPLHAEAAFDVASGPGSRVTACRLVTERTQGQPTHIRRLEVDGTAFDLDDVPDAAGVLCSRIRFAGQTRIVPNCLRQTIERFAGGTPFLDAAGAVENARLTFGLAEGQL